MDKEQIINEQIKRLKSLKERVENRFAVAKKKEVEYQEAFYNYVIDTIILNYNLGESYNKGFCFDEIDLYREFGGWPFFSVHKLSLLASKRSLEENIIVKKVLGPRFVNSNLVEYSPNSLVNMGLSVSLDNGEKYTYSIEEKEQAINYMTNNHVPLTPALYKTVLKKFRLGAIKLSKNSRKSK